MLWSRQLRHSRGRGTHHAVHVTTCLLITQVLKVPDLDENTPDLCSRTGSVLV